MERLRLISIIGIVLCLILVACGSPTPPPGNGPTPPPDNGDPPPGDPNACAVIITESITVATRLTKTDKACDYLIQPRGGAVGISVQNGPLVVDPGVVIQLARDVVVTFSDGGSLQAVGTPEEPIRIEGAQPIRGYATGLRFNDSAAAMVNTLEHVRIAYMGRERSPAATSKRGAISGSARLSMKHTTIRGSNFHGAYLSRMALEAFENNTFADNTMYPVVVSARWMDRLDNGSDYLGSSLELPNGRPYVSLTGVGSNETAVVDALWRNLSAPYYIDNAVWVDAGEITIEPGTRFVFGPDAGIAFRSAAASLMAIGTEAAPIIFTGEQAIPGYWNTIRFSNSARGRFEHVGIGFGGGGSIYNANITLTVGSPYVYLENSLIAHSAGCGIDVRSGLAEWDATTVFQENVQDVCS
jgi:hypothetical protein